MKLDVLTQPAPWYSDGLKFTCTQCGDCCTGGPGFVWISEEEVSRLAEFLKLTPADVFTRYCRKVGGRWSLKERKTPAGLYDCIFLQEVNRPQQNLSRRDIGSRHPSPRKQRRCSIYPVRPLQCRTWPFWDSNLASEEAWKLASRRCPGMGRGTRHFTQKEIDSLANAEDWPPNPPAAKG